MDKPRAWIGKYHPIDRCCDAACRMSDTITLHAIAGAGGQFAAIRLADGGSDQTPYETRYQAQFHGRQAPSFTILIPPSGMTATQAEEVLHYHRDIFEHYKPDPGDRELVMPLLARDRARTLHRLKGRR